MSGGAPRARDRQSDVPFGWTLVYRDYFDNMGRAKRKTMWRCPELQKTLDGDTRRCTFVCKKSRIRQHKHNFDIPGAEDAELQRRKRTAPNKRFNDSVIEMVGEFAGAIGLSVSAAGSDAMRKFIVKVMDCALSYRAAYPDIHFNPDTEVPVLNRAKITEALVQAGRGAYSYLERKMEHYLYVNVMIDAATVLNMRVVHTTLANPFSDLPPIPFHATEKNDQEWCAEEYVTELSSILTELKTGEKMIPVAICHDRLCAQASAVARTLNLLKQSDDPTDGLLVDVPCMNHLLNNAFSSCLRGKFKIMIQEVNDFADRIRTREAASYIRKKCPVPPATRWLYITDTLGFILKNKQRIQQFLAHQYEQMHPNEEIDSREKWEMYQNHISVPLLIVDLYAVLMPFKLASLSLESESSRLSDILPIVRQLQKTFSQMMDESLIEADIVLEFLHEMLCEWLARLETFLPAETWACWALTRQGRYELRKRVQSSPLLCGSPCDYTRSDWRKNERVRVLKEECAKVLSFVMNEKRNLGGSQDAEEGIGGDTSDSDWEDERDYLPDEAAE